MSLYKERWTTEEGVALCHLLEPLVEPFDCHVALTGGLLYAEGPRKDCDIVIYRRGRYKDEDELPAFDRDKLLDALKPTLIIYDVYARVVKAGYKEKAVDLLFVNTFDGQGVEGDST